MDVNLLLMALVVGVANWGFRFLPTRLDLGAGRPEGWAARFLAATGPAAIGTLCVASVLPEVTRGGTLGPLAVGIAVVLGVYGWRRSVVAATLAGAFAYGVVFALV